MKKIFNLKTMSLALVLIMVCSMFAACGASPEMKAAAGTYAGEYTKFVGDSDEYKVTDEEFSLDLRENGKGTHHRDTLDISVEWSVTADGEFKMTETFLGAKSEYTGTLKDGKLDIFNGDPTDDFTCEYVYNKK